MTAWPFEDPPNVAVFTRQTILRGEAWVSYVSHDLDDGAWQFHADTPARDEDAAIVSLETMVRLEPRVSELRDLPPGWCAWRDNRQSPWKRAPLAVE